MRVIDTISYIIEANVTEDQFPANASSRILQDVEEQIARTLRETGQFKAVTPNLAAEGVAINNTQFHDGIGFIINRMNERLSDTVINNQTDSQDQSYIHLPQIALFGNESGKLLKSTIVWYLYKSYCLL